MNRRTFRLLAAGLAAVGLVSLIFLTPYFAVVRPDGLIDADDATIMAWCIIITATAFGVGLGLIVASFLNLNAKRPNNHKEGTGE